MSTLNTLQSIIMILMWMIIMISMKTKTTKMLCFFLTVFSVLVSMMMSTILKLTLIPFITILTMAGGLMILFLYFTASFQEDLKTFKLKPFPMIPFFLVMVPLMMKKPMSINTQSPMKDTIEPSSILFTLPMSPMTITLMVLLGFLLIVVVFICSKPNSPMRKKK